MSDQLALVEHSVTASHVRAGWRAECSCGYVGSPRHSRAETALAEAEIHMAEHEKTTTEGEPS